MNNDVELIPVKGVLPTVQAQSDNVIYVPQAHKNKAGIVKEGDGVLIENGTISFDDRLIKINEIYVNGELLKPDENKRIGIVLDKSDVGLSDVDNTADINKPISIAAQAEFDRINGLIKGADKAIAYNNYAELVSVLNNATNDLFLVGQSIFINTLNVPDLWIYSVEDSYIQYTYVDDVSIETLLNTVGFVQIGYYKIAAMETHKINVENYVTLDTEQTLTAFKEMSIYGKDGDLFVYNIDDGAGVVIDTYTKRHDNKGYVSISPTGIYGSANLISLLGKGDDYRTSLSMTGSVSLSVTSSNNAQKTRIDLYPDSMIFRQNDDVVMLGNGLRFNGSSVVTQKDLSNYVTLDTQQTITGIKIFTEQIGLTNGSVGDINYIKHINNNFLISSNTGDNIIDIDEQLKTFNFYNKPLALEEYVNDNFISYTKNQSLTDEQKEIARNNIGAGTGSGESIDLSNYVTLDTQQTLRAGKNIKQTTLDGTIQLNLTDPMDISFKVGSDDVGYFEFNNMFNQQILTEFPNEFILYGPKIRYTTSDGSVINSRKHDLSFMYNKVRLSYRSPSVYEDYNELTITADGIFYNDNEIATKSDIATAITTTLNVAV